MCVSVCVSPLSLPLGDAVSSFVSADLVPTIIVLLTDDDSLPEILSNVLTLIRALTPSGKFAVSNVGPDLVSLLTHTTATNDEWTSPNGTDFEKTFETKEQLFNDV